MLLKRLEFMGYSGESILLPEEYYAVIPGGHMDMILFLLPKEGKRTQNLGSNFHEWLMLSDLTNTFVINNKTSIEFVTLLI
jgi:hypothetical protein